MWHAVCGLLGSSASSCVVVCRGRGGGRALAAGTPITAPRSKAHALTDPLTLLRVAFNKADLFAASRTAWRFDAAMGCLVANCFLFGERGYGAHNQGHSSASVTVPIYAPR